jgi:hypothetical protein
MSQGSGADKTERGQTGEQVIDFGQARAQKLEEKRRKTERIFFKSLLSVYTVVSGKQMAPIEISDVSESGISFQIPFNADNPWPADQNEIPLRMYFSQDTFLEVIAKIQNSRSAIENGQRYVRFGCAIDTSVSSYPAYQQFVRFLKQYSEHAHKDMGDVTVFYL